MVLMVRFLNESAGKNSLVNNPFWIQLINDNFQGYENSLKSLRTEITHWDKFKDLKMHLESLGTWMTSPDIKCGLRV